MVDGVNRRSKSAKEDYWDKLEAAQQTVSPGSCNAELLQFIVDAGEVLLCPQPRSTAPTSDAFFHQRCRILFMAGYIDSTVPYPNTITTSVKPTVAGTGKLVDLLVDALAKENPSIPKFPDKARKEPEVTDYILMAQNW